MCIGVPRRVVEIVDAEGGVAAVDVDGRTNRVSLQLLDGDGEVTAGDWVLVHLGFAMAKLDEDEALETLRMFEDLADG